MAQPSSHHHHHHQQQTQSFQPDDEPRNQSVKDQMENADVTGNDHDQDQEHDHDHEPDHDHDHEDENDTRPNFAYLEFQITPHSSPPPNLTRPTPATPTSTTSTTSNQLFSITPTPSVNSNPMDSFHVEVAKTDKPNIISIHVFMRIPMERPLVECMQELQPVTSSITATSAQSNGQTHSTPSSSTTSTTFTPPATSTAATSSTEPLPLTSTVTIVDSIPNLDSSSSTLSPIIGTSSPNSTLVRFSIPLYNFAKHNYLAASSHLVHSYPAYFAHLLENTNQTNHTHPNDLTSFSEESLSNLIEQAVQHSYELWASHEKSSSNNALLSVLSSLKISWDCASAFVEQEVELSDLLFLNEQDLKQFIPKLGPRRRLNKWIEEERLKRKEEAIDEDDGDESEEEQPDDDHQPSSSPHGSPDGGPAESGISVSPTPFSASASQQDHHTSDVDDHDQEDNEKRPHSSHLSRPTSFHRRMSSSFQTDSADQTQTEQSETEHDDTEDLGSRLKLGSPVERSVVEEEEDDDGDDANGNMDEATDHVSALHSRRPQSGHGQTDSRDSSSTTPSDYTEQEDEESNQSSLRPATKKSATSSSASSSISIIEDIDSDSENEMDERVAPTSTILKHALTPPSATTQSNRTNKANGLDVDTSFRAPQHPAAVSHELDDSLDHELDPSSSTSIHQPPPNAHLHSMDDGYEGHDDSDG